MVYVDNMRAPFGRLILCHMMADSRDELLAMATTIGVKHKWIQKLGEPGEHFDICLSKRAKAVAAGAKEITVREMAIMNLERRTAYAKKMGWI